MSVLDARQFLLSSFYLDPATNSLLGTPPTNSSSGGGKIGSSFRISDLLHQSPSSDQSTDLDPRASSEECRSSPLRGSPPLDESLRGSPSEDSPGGSKKARKARTIFTDKQLQELETTFEKQKYLSVQDRMDLAQRMGLSDTQVKTWYQNRRTKWKRQASVGMDLLSDAGNMAAVQQLLRTNPYWATCMGANFGANPLASLGAIGAGMPNMLPSTMPLLMGYTPFSLMMTQPTSDVQCSSAKPSSPPLDVSSSD